MKSTATTPQEQAETNERFQQETTRFRFHYRCDACAHIHRATKQCSMGYPNDFMLNAVVAIQPDGNLTFCKYFELGETIEPLV